MAINRRATSEIVRTFTEEEVRLLQQGIDDTRSYKTTRPMQSESNVERDEILAPEVYVCRTPSGGIPPATSAGEGLLTPGYADCRVYQVVDVSGIPDLREIGTSQRVYTFSLSGIEGNVWQLIKRDKFGRWWAEVPGTESFLAQLTAKCYWDGSAPRNDAGCPEGTALNCPPTASCDKSRFIAYSWRRVLDNAESVAITYTDGVNEGSPQCFPAYHEQNLDLPVYPPPSPVAGYPRTLVTDATAGSIAWTAPENAALSDDSHASAELAAGQTTKYLKATHFCFGLAGHLTITNVEVRVEAHASAVNAITDLEVVLLKGNGETSSNKATLTTLPASDGVRSYSFSPGSWGLTLTPLDGNSTGFGVRLRYANNDSVTRSVLVDAIEIRISFTPPGQLNVEHSVVRLRRGRGDYYLIDQAPWNDLFRATGSRDGSTYWNAFLRYWDPNALEWRDGEEVRLILPNGGSLHANEVVRARHITYTTGIIPVCAAEAVAGDGAGDCDSCGWLADVPLSTCMRIRMRGGYGRCACIPNETGEDEGAKAVWVDAFDGWLTTEMRNTCCGCGGMVFSITSPEELTAELFITNVHVSCEPASESESESGSASSSGSGSSAGPGLFTLAMRLVCCGRNPGTGQPYAMFMGFGPASCSGERGPCDNTFYVTVECDECPSVVCSCCCLAVSPPAWYFTLAAGNFTSNTLNGFWILKYDGDDTTPCHWRGACAPTGTTSVLEHVDADAVFRLTHGTAIYEVGAAEWNCSSANRLTWVSGGGDDPPPFIDLAPILPVNEDSPTDPIDPLVCSPPDELTAEIVAPSCPVMNVTEILTRVSPASNSWQWTNPVITGSRVTAITLTCGASTGWSLVATAACDGEASPFSLGTVGRPTTNMFGPLELQWTSQTVTGGPGPVPGCCATGGGATITVLEA